MTAYVMGTDSYPWSSTDPKMVTAKSLLAVMDENGDHPNKMTRLHWYDGFGRYFLQQKPDGSYDVMRDYWPGSAISPAYKVQGNFQPDDDFKQATDYRTYG